MLKFSYFPKTKLGTFPENLKSITFFFLKYRLFTKEENTYGVKTFATLLKKMPNEFLGPSGRAGTTPYN